MEENHLKKNKHFKFINMKINLETHTQGILPIAGRHWLKTNEATPNLSNITPGKSLLLVNYHLWGENF